MFTIMAAYWLKRGARIRTDDGIAWRVVKRLDDTGQRETGPVVVECVRDVRCPVTARPWAELPTIQILHWDDASSGVCQY